MATMTHTRTPFGRRHEVTRDQSRDNAPADRAGLWWAMTIPVTIAFTVASLIVIQTAI